VIAGGEGGGRWFGGIDRQLRALMLSRFVSQKLGTFIAKPNGGDLVVLKELIEAGKVTPVIGKTYPLSKVPEAHPSSGRRIERSRDFPSSGPRLTR
jgi:hypothetical protein